MGNIEYFEEDEFRELLEEYEGLINSGQPVFMDADDLADIADYYQYHERSEESKRAIDRAMELAPDSPIVMSYKVHEALLKGDYEAAEAYLEQMCDHEHPEYIYCRAEIWIVQGEIAKADRHLCECMQYMFGDEWDYIYDVSNLWMEYNQKDKALEWLAKMPQDALGDEDELMELMGRTFLGLGAYDDSERIFNKLLDKDPFQKRYWHALANAQYMKEDYGASVASSEYAIAIDPDDPAGIMAKANALFRLENYEEALQYYERHFKKQPEESALLYQACCLVNLKRNDEACQLLLKARDMAAEDSPYLADIYQELAFVHNEMRLYEVALEYLDKAEKLEYADHADMLVIRGHILLSAGRMVEATAAFDEALRESEQAPNILLRIIVSIYDNQFLESAYETFLKYFEVIDDDCADGYSYMALCCRDLLYETEYLHYLKEACYRNPNEARLVLGHLFPANVKPEEYYEYAKKQLKT